MPWRQVPGCCLIKSRSHIVISRSNDFLKEQHNAKGGGELRRREPDAHQGLLEDGQGITEADHKASKYAQIMVLVLQPNSEEELAHGQ